MDNSISFGCGRKYADILLEEIALEGLDGITLELLLRRLEANPDWRILPIDESVEEFIWKELIALNHVDWYKLTKPRESPPVFATFEEYFNAAENDAVDVVTYSSFFYPHTLINDGKNLGSCSTYHERMKVTHEIQTMSYNEVKAGWYNKLVVVASQKVRKFVLLPSDENPELEMSDISYCILERIGRGRRCGEVTLSLNFMKNGANPTFYFWDKLRKRKIIKTQIVATPGKGLKNGGYTNCTLIHLSRFYKKVPFTRHSVVLQLAEKIKSSPNKMCLFSDLEDLLHSRSKLIKSDLFRRYIKISFIPYKEYFPDAPESAWKTSNENEKLVRVLKLANENFDSLENVSVNDEYDEEVNDDANENGILDGKCFFNRPLISRCYHVVDSSGVRGISMIEVQRELGLSKLLARLLLRNLQKNELIVSISSDDARKRCFRYYSMKFSEVVQLKVREHVGKFTDLMETSVTDESNMNEEPSMTDVKAKDTDDANQLKTSSPPKVTIKRSSREKSEEFEKSEEPEAKRLKVENSLTSKSTLTESLQNKINSVVSISTECSISANESMFVLRRLNILLDHIYKSEVVLRMFVARIIFNEETKRGIHQGLPANNSVKKVVNILKQSGKIKIIEKTVLNENLKKSRTLQFLCIPSVTDDHPIIQNAVEEALRHLSIVYIKGGTKKRSKLTPPPYAPRKCSSKYDYSAKFARMKILHELLTYILYQYEGDENLDGEECKKFVKPLLFSTDSVDELPKFYKKEISWKMFIPPLMKYEEYSDGWISSCDLGDRLPIKLFFALIRLPYEHPDLDNYLLHPVKQYYLIRHLPPHLQEFITVDNSYLYSLYGNLKLLCHAGLAQFGPKTKIRGSQNLIYLNKKIELKDTRSSAPGYMKITPNVDYPTSNYNFTESNSLDAFWNDAMRFCISTKLGRKKYCLPDEAKRSRHPPERLAKTVEVRTINEANLFDNGEMPGDRLGAAGFDSWLLAHAINQWFRNKNEKKIAEGTMKNVKITKALKPAPKPPSKRVSKLMRYRHQVIRKRARSRISFDKIDLEALNKMRTLRVKWCKAEDEILLMGHIASKFYSKPITLPFYRPYILIRKLLHALCDKSADKTVHACKRRIIYLLRNSLKKHSVNLCVKEMSSDVELQNKFQDISNEIEKYSNIRDLPKTKALLDQLTEDVFHHLYYSKKMSVLTKGTYEVSLPNTITEFEESYTHEYALLDGQQKYLQLNNKKDIAVLSIINLIFSTLLSQVDKTEVLNVTFLYGIFKQFNDNDIKSALHYVRANRLISYNKSIQRDRILILPFGKGMYHLSLTFHKNLKTSYSPAVLAATYNRYLESVSYEDGENVPIGNFDFGLTLLLTSYVAHNRIDFLIKAPDVLLLFDDAPIVYQDVESDKHIVKHRKTLSSSTLSMIYETLFDGKANKELTKNEDDKCFVKNDIEVASANDAVEVNNDDDDDDDDDDKVDFSTSKISIYVTRNQFKNSDIRFSNAYDHYMISPYQISYNFDGRDHSSMFVAIDRVSFLNNLAKSIRYTKVAYTGDELMQKIRKCFHEIKERDYAVNVLEFLDTKGICGATGDVLKNEFRDLNTLKNVIDIMIQKKLIIRNGSTDTCYVHINFAEHWLIRSCLKENVFMPKDKVPDLASIVLNRKSYDESQFNQNNRPLWLAIRPWVHVNGSINESSLESLLVRILSYVLKKPFVSLMNVQKQFTPALQPHCTRELVELLEQLQCLKSYAFKVKNKITLFSKEVDYVVDENVTDFENEDCIILEPDINAFVKFSLFLSKTNYEDLLEVKYCDGEFSDAVNAFR